MDSETLVSHVNYVHDFRRVSRSDSSSSTSSGVHFTINICGHLWTPPFTRRTFEQIFPVNHAILFALLVAVADFASFYLPLSLRDGFDPTELWLLSIVLDISAYSILAPPAINSYISTPNHC
jgi:hypothetical protein